MEKYIKNEKLLSKFLKQLLYLLKMLILVACCSFLLMIALGLDMLTLRRYIIKLLDSERTIETQWAFEEINILRNGSRLGSNYLDRLDEFHICGKSDIFITKLVIDGETIINDDLTKGDKVIKLSNISAGSVAVKSVPYDVVVKAAKDTQNSIKLFIRRRKVNMYRITLSKGKNELGFNITREIDGGIYITQISEGGAAQIDGRLEIGDKLIMIKDILNGTKNLENATYEEAIAALKTCTDQVTLIVKKKDHMAEFNIQAISDEN